jgi:hypothetical protein
VRRVEKFFGPGGLKKLLGGVSTFVTFLDAVKRNRARKKKCGWGIPAASSGTGIFLFLEIN